jgi:hypothetical protein
MQDQQPLIELTGHTFAACDVISVSPISGYSEVLSLGGVRSCYVFSVYLWDNSAIKWEGGPVLREAEVFRDKVIGVVWPNSHIALAG